VCERGYEKKTDTISVHGKILDFLNKKFKGINANQEN
jgi:hypothetical protein